MKQAYVSQTGRCKYCGGQCVKAGKHKNGHQRLYCKDCLKYQQACYTYYLYHSDTNKSIIKLLTESCGIRSTARLIGVSTQTVTSRILSIATGVQKPTVLMNKVFEMDELKTFVKHKQNEIWVIYAIDRESKQVTDLKVGKRNKKNLQRVTDTLL